MAARWGAGEETLTACNMDFFHMDTLDESPGQISADTLEALQSSLDPSILSIFEETPTIDTKGLDEESEATLLTALTEILDNVDEENLSPFDTLPDAELLSGQKGREHSPLKRLLCLSRSPPEKDALCGTRTLSTGKNLQRIQINSLQRSDGEEEEDGGSFTLSPIKDDSCPDSGLMDWEGLTLPLPVTFEQEGEDGVSVSLGDLVRHMHPYCMAICVENEDGEQMLPEGGIVLEVVDQGENGEPILAFPDMSLPLTTQLTEPTPEKELKVSADAEEDSTDSSELIVVDDDDDEQPGVSPTPVKAEALPTTIHPSDVKDKIVNKKEEVREKSPSRKKKKKKCKEQPKPDPVEGRVLRSARRSAKETIETNKMKTTKVKTKQKVSKTLAASTTDSVPAKLKETMEPKNEALTETTTTIILPEINAKVGPAQSDKKDEEPSSDEKSLASTVSTPHPSEAPTHTPSVDSTAAPLAASSPSSSESPAAAPSLVTSHVTPPVIEAPAVPEPKPKSLSLAEYRRLRQQKKPAPVEKKDTSSTKWPSLPELPKELPPIPCLPDLSPKDPRRFNPQAAKKQADEVKPAWQPRGPGAPPTPEALLAPPAYMVSSSSRTSIPAPKPQQAPEASKQTQQLSTPAPSSVKNSAPHQYPTAQAAAPCAPQNPGPSVKLASEPVSSAEKKCSAVLPGGKDEVNEIHQAQPETHSKTTTAVIRPAAATGSSASVSQKTTVVPQKVSEVTSRHNHVITDSKSTKPSAAGTPQCVVSSGAASHLQRVKPRPVVLQTKEKPTTAVKLQKAPNPTQELIQAFTTEIGIEAADLTSLLEQFEETQAKVEHCVPEVCGRAAAVGNSSVELVPEKSVVERVRANDFSNTAALTPPATPPHQMWKPLAPVALLGKNKITESSKSTLSKIIQIEARPLPLIRSRSKPSPAPVPVDPEVACMDHDYCLPNNSSVPEEPGKRWNVKQQSAITIKPIKPHAATAAPTPPAAQTSLSQGSSVGSTKTKQVSPTQTLDNVASDKMEKTSILETPDASPARREMESTMKDGSPKRGPYGRSYRHRTSSSRSPSPARSPKERTGGRSRKRKSHRSPSPMSSYSESDSDSSRSRSRSFSPKSKRYRGHRSESSSSSSSSCSSQSRHSVSRSPPRRRRYSYSSSRSGSWSRSRSRSRSPHRRAQWNRNSRLYSPTYQSYCGQGTKPNVEELKRRKEKAIEERRIVYVGRIRGTMTQKELRERFSYFGEIEECTLHFRDHGDNYGFVTYYDTKDAFTAIENGSKLRKPDELPFDLCFGGRRQFCKATYADLDSSREYDPLPGKGKYHALDFDTLLKQAKQNLKR